MQGEYKIKRSRIWRVWLRYNWWKPLLHIILIVLCIVNLYPFFWMLGTSLKAEAEASNERMTPFPELKYKLSKNFSIKDILPFEIEPSLKTVEDDNFNRLLTRLKNKLLIIEKLQNSEWKENVLQVIQKVLFISGEPEVILIKNEIDKIKSGMDIARSSGRRSHYNEMRKLFLEKNKELNSRIYKYLLYLEETGCIKISGHKVFPDNKIFDSEYIKKESLYVKKVIEALREHFVFSTVKVAYLVKADIKEALAYLFELRDIGVLKEINYDSESGFVLSSGAKESIYNGLRPRQILMMFSMYEENARRKESRATYAVDCRSVKDYASAFGIPDLHIAKEELEEARKKGLLTYGSLQWKNYWVVLKGEHFLLYTITSIVITAATIIGVVISSSMLGYALARMNFPGRMWVLSTIIVASILPGEARIIPIFNMLLSAGALKNLWGMVLWLISFGIGNALLMAGFFISLPKEVDEAAQVDGAGVFRTFFDIALPMARPIVMTVGLFAFLNAWNNFLIPLLCSITRPSMQPLAVAVYNFQQGHLGKWHEINAAASIMIVPVILLFLCVQKHVVRSIAVGAIKG